MSAKPARAPRRGTSRREQKAATRAAIKVAARRCFAREGFTDTAIADIAEAAGVAHGTFYVHFASKEGVLDELLEEFNAELVRRLRPVFEAVDGALLSTTVRRTAEVFLDYWQEDRAFVEAYAQRSAAGLSLTTLRDGVNPPMAGLLRGAIERAAALAGAVRAINFELVTQALLALWLRVGLQYLFNDAVSRQDAVDVLVRMSVGAIDAAIAARREEGQRVSATRGSRG